MKNRILFAVVCLFITQADAASPAVKERVLKQQQDLCISLIKHYKQRLPRLVPATLHKEAACNSLDTLASFLSEHPHSIECVIDTFRTCIEARCTDIPTQVDQCIEKSRGMYDFPDTQTVQQKLSALVIFYFNFNLSPLETVDHYSTEFLDKTNLATYWELAKPVIGVIATYYALSYAFSYLNKVIDSKIQAAAQSTPQITGTTKDPQVNTKPSADVFDQYPMLKKFRKEVLEEIPSTSIKFLATGLLNPNLVTTVERTNRYLRENVESGYARLIGKNRKSGYPAKPSKESFKTIKGYDDLKLLFTPLVDFAAHLTAYRFADLKMARGYLLEGDLGDARKFAQAIAGEITAQLQDFGSHKKWMVYEMHASSLTDKGLDKVLNECLEFGPTVLIINNLDWIYTQKDVPVEVYSHIINKLGRYLSNESNAPLIICATSKNHTLIDPVMLEANKLEYVPLNETIN